MTMNKTKNVFEIFILSLSALAVVSQLYIPIPLTEEFSHYFNSSSALTIWISSIFGFSYAAGFLFFGPLSDRFGRKKILLPGLFFLGIITIAISFVQSIETMLLLRCVQGFIAASFAPAALAYINEQLPVEKRATGIAWISTGFMSAGVLGQIYASTINESYGWPTLFFIAGCIYIILGFMIATQLKETTTQANSYNLFQYYKNMVAHLRNSKLLIVYLCAFILLLSFVAMYSGLSVYLTKNYEFNSKELFHLRIYGLIGVMVVPFTGTLITKLGNRRVLITGLTIASTCLLLEMIVPQVNMIILSSIGFVLGTALCAPAIISNVATIAITSKAAAISLYTFILFSGAAVGSLLANVMNPYGFKALILLIFAAQLFCLMTYSFATREKI